MPTAMVSGCFDMLHSGHVAFLASAAEYGDLHVAIGSDRTVQQIKGAPPENGEKERLFMIRSLRCVKHAFISRGSGVLDFEQELTDLKPDVFLVNDDGHHSSKADLCKRLGVQYRILNRVPAPGLPQRSTTRLRTTCRMPYRIDLAGGWLDQPFVSRHEPGQVVVASIEPNRDFDLRSGMATSTRSIAAGLWGTRLPSGNLTQLAKTLFAVENPPGSDVISGSQDALGMVLPGINQLYYRGNYWPDEITSITDFETIAWLESLLHIKQTGARPAEFDVLANTCITAERVRDLAVAANDCWQAVQRRDAVSLGSSVRRSFEAQIQMFPAMLTSQVDKQDLRSSSGRTWLQAGGVWRGWLSSLHF